MAIISAYTIIRAISIFHITAAYFFLVSPKKIVDQNVVYILGESMKLPHIETMDKASQASALVALLLALLGISDLTAANMNEEVAIQYWLANVPVRMVFLFVVTGYVYLFKPGGLLGPSSITGAGMGEPLQNSLVFAWGFMELAAWFWVGTPQNANWPELTAAQVFTNLRDERRELAKRRQEKLNAEQDSQRL
ncbi:hypothetical protein LTR62_008787 [Meristemomyces frigidus]|uniref:Increased loss of mitochondrial DNA protein 1 n=1 Tax=Meristemomyces frigidus TaxID=1508187 RepID=A0AAN7T9C7_9PEZI|nr:hypothetical protein LTR62_008787 [Meristemomyces frigidus]